MNVCALLLGALNFEPTALQPCCNTRNTSVPSFPYHGGPIDFPAYQRHITETFGALQGDAALCKGCPELQAIDLSLPDDAGLLTRFGTVSLNQHRYACNCKCVYCNLWHPNNHVRPYPVLEGLKSLTAQGALREDCHFSWGGGEPTILADFHETCLWVASQGYAQYIHTNALQFSPILAAVLETGKGGVNISLDSGSAATYRRVKGVDGWKRVLLNWKKYSAISGSTSLVDVKYIVFEKNNDRKEIERFLALCQEFGVRGIQYSLDFREVYNGTVAEKTLESAAYLAHRATSAGLSVSPFFIDEPYLSRIIQLGGQ